MATTIASTTSRKIAYVLGAGFSYGSNHTAPVGNQKIGMPLQLTLFKELCSFHFKQIRRLDETAKAIRKYFSPKTYRASRERGAYRHRDLFGLSVEEVVTFFDEIVTNSKGNDVGDARLAAEELQRLTVELISYLSTNGSPGKNKLLKSFVSRLLQTDVIISFNWDTLLDRVLMNQSNWHPAWGYGTTVRNEFEYAAREAPSIPNKYPRLLKLHGSINWVAYEANNGVRRVVMKDWHANERERDVVMMPPKMIKPEVWGKKSESAVSGGNNFVTDDFYPALWKEAEDQLSRCRRIVFIGYSFPPADFAVSNMLRRAISEMKVSTGRFPEVDIVDPNAARLAERFGQSFAIEVPISNQFLSLGNYLISGRAT